MGSRKEKGGGLCFLLEYRDLKKEKKNFTISCSVMYTELLPRDVQLKMREV